MKEEVWLKNCNKQENSTIKLRLRPGGIGENPEQEKSLKTISWHIHR